MSSLTEALWDRYRDQGDQEARAGLLECYIGLVHHAARSLVGRIGRETELDDLVSAGTIGLIEALEGFDRSRGLAFSTYAVPRIRGSMLDELRSRDWTPRVIRERGRRLAGVRQQLQGRFGRAPREEELAEALGVEVETYRQWEAESEERVVMALDQTIEGASGEALSLAETIRDPALELPDDEMYRREALSALEHGFTGLSEKDRLVLSLYYFEHLNLRQIGEVLHVTESRVSQIHMRALRRLRECAQLTEEDA
ncbi:MAG: sigma-70 family RNA polymerase sigma factor [Candidatus Eiseniibacteriota bacterium]